MISIRSSCCTRQSSLALAKRRVVKISRALRDETPEEAFERRKKETEQYSSRVSYVESKAELEKAIEEAGSKLVVLEVQSETVCQTGLDDDTDDKDITAAKRDNWGNITVAVKSQAQNKCADIKHTFQRIARDSKDAVFLEVQVDDDPSAATEELLNHLGVDILPTLQFWKQGVKIYEHRGSQNMDTDMAEGVLYWDGAMAEGQKAGQFVKELKSVKEVEDFAAGSVGDKVLRVVAVSKMTSSPCLHMYPAVIALAKNFAGFASFARILVDDCRVTECLVDNDVAANTEAVMKSLNVQDCPTFVFYSSGKEVGRFVGSSRVELMSSILQVQQSLGVSPPPKPGQGVKAPRQKIVRRV